MKPYSKRVVGLWKKEIETSVSTPRLFFPYITSKTADSVVEKYANGHCEIYTSFEAESFASGASSLATLKQFLLAGHELYHLPNLHAKIFLLPDQTVSVGSQNLTNRGTRNKEVSVVSRDKNFIKSIERLTKPWLDERVLITAELFSDMEQLLPQLEKLLNQTKKEAKRVDSLVWEQHFARRLAYEAAQEAEAERDIWRLTQRKLLEDAPQSDVIYCSVNEYDSQGLSARYGGRFTNLAINHQSSNLYRLERYLYIDIDTGRLGWPRIADTVINFFATGIRNAGTVNLGGSDYNLDFKAELAEEMLSNHNLIVDVKNIFGQRLCNVQTRLGLKSLEFRSCYEVYDPSGSTSEAIEVGNWIRTNPTKFCEAAMTLATSFRFEENLTGVHAKEFFRGTPSDYQVRAARIEGQIVLVGTNWE